MNDLQSEHQPRTNPDMPALGFSVAFLSPANWDHNAHLVNGERHQSLGTERPSWEGIRKESGQILASALGHSYEPDRTLVGRHKCLLYR